MQYRRLTATKMAMTPLIVQIVTSAIERNPLFGGRPTIVHDSYTKKKIAPRLANTDTRMLYLNHTEKTKKERR